MYGVLVATSEASKVALAVVGALVALATLVKGVLELRSQGRQHRAEYFLKMMNSFLRNDEYLAIYHLLHTKDEDAVRHMSRVQRVRYMGFVEEVALLVKSNLVPRGVAHYMLGRVPIEAADSEAFMHDINPEELHWKLFFHFVGEMRELVAPSTSTRRLRGLRARSLAACSAWCGR